ncbi:MAG: hypothetical protein IT519_01330 [Burkholderiales bacterium]|jgi:hypothetical protein|nr:hypothetical protein [Burkholderiales bacterium]
MSRRPRSAAAWEARRAERRHGLGPDGEMRASLAQAAARLIAEHGLVDWSYAKRKAARELGLPARAALPRDDEVEDALAEYHALFGGDEHRAMIRERRAEALDWLRRFASRDARLVGGVAAGWATEHSDIRIELAADDAKSVEMELLNARIDFRPLPGDEDGAGEYYIETRRGGVRLSVRTPGAWRSRSPRDRGGREMLRLDAAAVERLLVSDSGSEGI